METKGPTPDRRSSIAYRYLADTIVLFRYYEFRGRIRAPSRCPRSARAHQHTIRDLVIDARGLRSVPPWSSSMAVLSGIPVYTGVPDGLEGDRKAQDGL